MPPDWLAGCHHWNRGTLIRWRKSGLTAGPARQTQVQMQGEITRIRGTGSCWPGGELHGRGLGAETVRRVRMQALAWDWVDP